MFPASNQGFVTDVSNWSFFYRLPFIFLLNRTKNATQISTAEKFAKQPWSVERLQKDRSINILQIVVVYEYIKERLTNGCGNILVSTTNLQKNLSHINKKKIKISLITFKT